MLTTVQGDQVASLYDLLTFEDKAAAEPAAPERVERAARPAQPRAASGFRRSA
jgi:hypothetical protein